jgi:AcrR family transcriptional regulator
VEQIAARAGVARTRIYRHFTDRADLEHAISERVAELIVAELDPLWHPEGSTRQMISAVIGAHAGWLAANRHLYAYLVAHSGFDGADAADGYNGVRQAVAEHLTGLFGGYFGLVGVSDAVAESVAYGILGLVESVTNRWLERPGTQDAAAVAEQLSAWVWAMLDSTLRAAGVAWDPDAPLPPLG